MREFALSAKWVNGVLFCLKRSVVKVDGACVSVGGPSKASHFAERL